MKVEWGACAGLSTRACTPPRRPEGPSPRGGADAADAVASALREARAAAAIAHPNATAVYDADEIDGLPYIVMELVPGHLAAARSSSGLPVSMTLRLRSGCSITAGALGAAHQVSASSIAT